MENNILKKISRQIVDKRVIIMIAFLAACVYCALSISRVHVNNDITSFLPPDTDTRRGLTIMENEFTTYASANVMLANTTYERASAAAEKIETLEHVTGVTFDNSPAHFVDSAALLTISFDGTSDDENVIAAMNEIRSLTAGFDTYTSSDIGADLLGEIAQQMVGVVALAAVVIMAVLLFTSRSYFEVVIFLIVFSVAALLNMGTNFWLGEISSITNSIAVILQLALAIDYAIIFSHRYQDEIDRFENANDLLTKMQLHVGHLSALMSPLTYVIINIAIVALLYVGSIEINVGGMASGDVIALVNYMNQILIELVKLANLIVQVSKALACAGRVQAVLDTKPGMDFPAELRSEVPADKAGDAVRFDHVSLTYAGAGAPSLSDISFTAKRGQTIGVIGGTGSGKSSLVNLIPRFYDATEGTVEILGRPAADYPREALRGKVNVVMQKAQLFGGTIRSNLLWGSKNATDAELWAALETAQAAEFVQAKPLGLDEPVEQGGRNLSGGQKQRLTIARALVGKPDILILDDSASALDYATDAALRKALAALPGSLTVFIVSQRAASLQHADQILVLDDGRLVGLGTHDQLRQSCPVYEEIYESQFKKGDVQK